MAHQQRVFFALTIISLLIAFNCANAFKTAENLQHFISTERIEAEDYSSALNPWIFVYDDCSDPNVFYVGNQFNDTGIKYQQVDFLDGMNSVILHVANTYSNSALHIALHLKNYTNPPFITIPVDYTGTDPCGFITINIDLNEPLSGPQDLYFTFPDEVGGQLRLDWFVFNRTADTINATETIQAEDFTEAYNYDMYDDCTDTSVTYVGDLYDYSLLVYRRVNFGSGVQMVTVRVSNSYAKEAMDIALHLGNYTNTPIASIPIDQTGSGRCNFSTFNTLLDTIPSGVQDLFLTFPSTQGGYLHVDWFVFTRDTHFIATEKMEAEDFTRAYNYDIYNDCTDATITYVGELYHFSVLAYERVDFGSGVQMVTLRVSNVFAGDPLDISLHLGNSTNTPIAIIPVDQTGSGRCDFISLNATLDTEPVGMQDLFLTFPSSQGLYIHLDWFVFNQTLTHQ